MDREKQEIEDFLCTLETFLGNVTNDIEITSPDETKGSILKTTLALLCDSSSCINKIRTKIAK